MIKKFARFTYFVYKQVFYLYEIQYKMRPNSRPASRQRKSIFSNSNTSRVSSNSSSNYSSLSGNEIYPNLDESNVFNSYRTQDLTESKLKMQQEIQKYPDNPYADKNQKINANPEQLKKQYGQFQSKAINKFVNSINSNRGLQRSEVTQSKQLKKQQQINPRDTFFHPQSSFISKNIKLAQSKQFIDISNNNQFKQKLPNKDNFLKQLESSISINMNESVINEQNQINQFIQNLIINYRLDSNDKSKLSGHLKNRQTDKLLTFFRKLYKQKAKLQINNFYQIIDKKKRQAKQSKSIETQISEMLISYGLQQQDFQQEMQDIKNQNFQNIINLAQSSKRIELVQNLKNVIHKHKSESYIQQLVGLELPQETKIAKKFSNTSIELKKQKQRERESEKVVEIKQWRKKYQKILDQNLKKLINQYASDSAIDEDNILWRAQNLNKHYLQQFKKKFQERTSKNQYGIIIDQNKKQIIQFNKYIFENFKSNLKRKKIKIISSPKIQQYATRKTKRYQQQIQQQYNEFEQYNKNNNKNKNAVKIIFKNNNELIKQFSIINGISQLRQKIFKDYDLNQSQYGIFFDSMRLRKLDDIFQSGKQKGILNIKKKIQLMYEFKNEIFSIWIEDNYNEAQINAEIIKDLNVRKGYMADEANIFLTFQAPNDKCYKFESLKKFKELYGGLKKIIVEIAIEITVYYQGQQKVYRMKSCQTIEDLKNQVQKDYIPKQAQLFQRDVEKTLMMINKNNENTPLANLCQEGKDSFQLVLTNAHTMQFYGFNSNYPQSDKQFTQFTVKTDSTLIQTIEVCNFSDPKQQQTFFNNFVTYLYSCIKKRFTIQSVIDRVKKLVAENKYENIWVPMENGNNSKMNESFVLMYLLSNSDQKFRIQMMNLVKNQMPIPLYLSTFKSIFDLKPLTTQNQQIAWILKTGITVCSLGLHTQTRNKQQKGKSYLLNNIFFTKFCQTDNKHKIVQKIPYVSIRVYDDLFPLNIIDIPRNCDQFMINKIVNACDLLIIQSWKNEQQSVDFGMALQQQIKTKTIIILRDSKQSINESLKSINQVSLTKSCILKLPNLSNTHVSQNVVSILRNKINSFLEQQKRILIYSKKILQICTESEINNLDSLIDNFERKNIDICQFAGYARCLESQRLGNLHKDKVEQLKKKRLNENIQKILIFLTKCKLPLETVLLYLRHRLRSIQNQTVSKYMKIYKIKKLLANSNCTQKQLEQLRIAINQLPSVSKQDQSLFKKSSDEIKKKLDQIMSDFENKIKPKIFSIELFWREVYAYMKFNPNYKINGQNLSALITELKSKQIMNNQPFQLIDGDCLEMPKDIFKKTFSSIDDNCLVISIIGPQSSGKSTLLNFLFGCDFATSEGRCTRGVYGTYFRLNDPRITNFEGIFVIDTQGLFAVTNQTDQAFNDRENFDSKLVLFCLAVSDFVIINVRGNLDKNTEKIISICHEKFQILNLREGQRPQIVIVLNQNNTSKTQQSQNQFKKIQKKLKFSIAKSFSQAYKIKNFEKNQICLLAQNQIITKKVPLSQFQKQTQNMFSQMIQIVKQKTCEKVITKIDKFFQIWQTVVSYPNLSKMTSKQYRDLELNIKKWKQEKQQKCESLIQSLIQQYRQQAIQENVAIRKLEEFNSNYLEEFKKQYELSNYNQQLRELIEYEKKCIGHKDTQNFWNLKCAIEECKMKKKLQQQTWEGDQLLKIQEKQIISNQNNKLKIYTQKQKQQIFNQCWAIALDKILKTINIKKKIEIKLKSILNNYQYLIQSSKSRLSNLGLPKQKQNLLSINQIAQNKIQIIEEKLFRKIFSKVKSPENFMIYTGKPHTNAVKGGRTDAKQKYFNMRNYFKQQQKINNYTISIKAIHINFIIEKFVNKVLSVQKQYLLKIGHSKYVNEAFRKINELLFNVGLQIENYQQFEEVYHQNTLGFFHKLANMFTNQKHLVIRKFYNANINKKYIKSQFIEIQMYDIAKLSHSRIYNYTKRCFQIIQKWQLKPISILEQIINQKIKWKQIKQYCRKMQSKNSQYQKDKAKKQANNFLCQLINKDIANINMKIQQNVNIIQIFEVFTSKKYKDAVPDYREFLQKIFESLKTINKQLIYANQNTLFQKINGLQYFYGWKLQQQLRINQKYQNGLQLGSVYYEAIIEADKQFQGYIQNNRNIKDKFQQTKFKRFILQQIKDKNKSLENFFKQILTIVKNVFRKWQNKFQKKSIEQIFSSINQQISLFNNDLNQISHQLHDVIIGQVHLMAIYMMWKLQVDDLIIKQNEPYQQKNIKRDKQLEKFMKRTSNNLSEVNQQQISAFFDQIFLQFQNIIKKKKQLIMIDKQRQFKSQVKRKQILKKIDAEILAKATETEIILQYLQNPAEFIEKKYEQQYEAYLNSIKKQLAGRKDNERLFNQYKQLFEKIRFGIIQVDKIKQEKGYPRDLLTMTNKNNVKQADYDEEGKKILFKYFLDKTLGIDQKGSKKCKDINLALTSQLAQTQAAKGYLHQILSNIRKNQKQLQISNLPKFVNTLLKQEVLQNFKDFLQEICEIQPWQQIEFKNKIRVSICKQKCPCCGRICGVEEVHQFHKCIFGHQMRGLAGNYIPSIKYLACQYKCVLCNDLCGIQSSHQFHRCNCGQQSKTVNTNMGNEIQVKQAFVVRCQQLVQTDLMQYNGETWTWTEFKKYWAQKQIGGWHYDDLNNNVQDKKRFINAWLRAGPEYCKRNDLQYVDYNDAAKQKKRIVGNIHFVFLLDQSGSMSGKPWQNLMEALNKALNKIIQYSDKKSNVKVSIINFQANAKIIFERLNPKQINVKQIPFANGSDTKFENAFSSVYQISNKYIHKEFMVIIFMTDGKDAYPENGVKKLQTLMQTYPKKITYSGIYAGTNNQQNNVMKLISNELKGRNILVTRFEELVDAYDSCIQIIATKPS